jgi:putative transposase
MTASPNESWIDLPTAVKRSGLQAGHITRLCRSKWLAEGRAELRTPPGGGKASWHVREDADERLARVKFAPQIGTDLRQFPETKRREALRRREILKLWEEHLAAAIKLGGFTREAATNHFCERLLIQRNERVSKATLYNWEASYRGEGLMGLVDRRGNAASVKAADPFLEEVKRLYLLPRQLKLTKCHTMASYLASEKGWPIRSYKSCQRMIASLPAGLIYKLRGGEDAFVARGETYIERDYTTLDSNAAWNSDHHQCDVIVNAGGKLVRPWLTVFQDIRSRKIMGWHIYAHDPNTDSILTCFRRAVLDHGVPEALFIDNGKDYDSYVLNGRTKKDRWQERRVHVELDTERTQGLFPQLSIDVRHVWPYHGQSKPVERWFGEFEQHTPVWETYCGRSTAAKPHDLQLQLERGKSPTLETFSEWFGDWLTQFEASHAHSGDGMDGKTPDLVYAECLHTKRTALAELLDLLCLKRVGPLRVGRNGVTWQGLHYGQFDPSLTRMLGDQVMLRIDEREVNSVQAYTLDDRFICLAPANAKVPFMASAQDLRSAVAAKRKDSKLLNEYIDRRPRIADDLPDRIVHAAAARAKAARSETTPPPPPNVMPIRHVLEGQLSTIQRAVEGRSNRIAVGAESMDGRFTYQPRERDPEVADMSFRELMAARKPTTNEGDDE